ncbi:MAG: hypothetical protein FWE82_05645 [Defluviitaleaceae bacterium]|nr:hypothetical protein [Defluviitaleaceae bacterium]
MFDSKKIAEQALLRAGEIEIKTERDKKIRKSVGVFGLCAASAAIVFMLSPVGNFSVGLWQNGGPSGGYVMLEDQQVPLSVLQPLEADKNAVPYTGHETGVSLPVVGSTALDLNTQTIDLLLVNPDNNPYLFVFDIKLAESGLPLYASDLVAPGMCIVCPSVINAPEAGEYKAVLTVNVYETESHTLINIINTEFNLLVG